MSTANWFTLADADQVDTPALLIYEDRVINNIKVLVNSIDSVDRLRPHIKTHKSKEVTRLLLEAGIHKFKCATIAEAEMLAESGAKDILLAYQPVGPKAVRLMQLQDTFPSTAFSCVIDNLAVAKDISELFSKEGKFIPVFIDLNVGMNRTGILPAEAFGLISECQELTGIKVVGLHAYDGHIRDAVFLERLKKCDDAFMSVKELADRIEETFHTKMIIVAGGTPTYSIHSKRDVIECSPGTFIYWDKGYETILPEQHYEHAALVMCRVISKPAENTICVDLGHKSIASENPLNNRVTLLNFNAEAIGHSEEHMVLKVKPGTSVEVGDVLYGIPYHVCPTVALYETAFSIENHHVKATWQTKARNRKITI